MSEEIKDIILDVKDSLNETPKNMYKYNKITLNLNEFEEILNYIEQLEKENIKQKEIIENLTTMTVCGDKKQIKNTAQYKLEQLENIRKEAIEYVYKHIQEYDVDGTFTNLDEFDFIASPQALLNILSKGDNNGK